MNQDWTPAASWSIWAGNLGRGFIWAGIFCYLAVFLVCLFPKASGRYRRVSGWVFGVGSFGVIGALGCLTLLFVKDQFQYQYVFAHGDTLTDLHYKVAGVWTAQQGSFLLWASCSALCGVLSLCSVGPLKRGYLLPYSLFQATLCGILAYETPFQLAKDAFVHGKLMVPPGGAGMTPSLQNYWVVIHPPVIFLGFGALTVLFSFAVAAMLHGDAIEWAKRVRPWSLVTLAVLGIGICMGGLWAYETQGWGGFWAWDPVENVSFVPWLFTVALAHGVIVQVSRKRWGFTNLLLAGLPFLTFVYGTFLTRSGLLDKVSLHSFASMDKSAKGILLAYLVLVTVGFFALWLTKGRKASQTTLASSEPGISRESLYGFGVLLISLVSVCIALGMSWPLISAVLGQKVSAVEERLYHPVVAWFFIPIMLLMAVSPFVSWRPHTTGEIGRRVSNVLAVAVGLTGFSLIAMVAPGWGVHADRAQTVQMPFGLHVPLIPWMAFLVFLCLFALVANLWRAIEMVKHTKMGLGGFVAHLGLAVLMAGLILSRGFEQKQDVFVREGSPVRALDYLISYKTISQGDPHDRNGTVTFEVTGPNGVKFNATPGLYFYTDANGEDKPMVWPHVQRSLSHDVYVSLSAPEIYAWPEPAAFKPGETKTVHGITVQFVKPTREGTPGQPGAKFGGVFRVLQDGKAFEANPTMELTGGGVQPNLVQAGPDFAMAIGGMNAADGTIRLQLLYSPAIYPITIYYKPLTILVWLGAGILFVGGLMAAIARRLPRTEPDRIVAVESESPIPVASTISP